MWWRLSVLAAATAALLVILFTPMPVSVRLKLPPSVGPAAKSEVVSTPAWIYPAASGILVIVVLLGAGLIARRIVRRHRKAA
jgi:hypothetical protein